MHDDYTGEAAGAEPDVELAQQLLERCGPLAEGSPQWRYLTVTRGLPVAAIRYCQRDLRALAPPIPGFDRLASGIVSLLRDRGGDVTGLAVETCGIAGERVLNSAGRTSRKTFALKRRGQIDALFCVPATSAGMVAYMAEGRLAKPVAVAALFGSPAVCGWGGLNGLGHCLPAEPTVVLIEDACPTDDAAAERHVAAMERGADRLILGGKAVLRAGGPPCTCCKDVDEALGRHPADELRAWIMAAVPAALSLDGHARRCAAIRAPLKQASAIADVVEQFALKRKGMTRGFREQVAAYAGTGGTDEEEDAAPGTGGEMTFDVVLPAGDPQDGEDLLDDMAAALCRHAHCSSEEDVTLGVLWIVHAERRWHGNIGTLPRCVVTAGREDSGKTHYAMACGSMMDRVEHTISPRPSNIYRAIEACGWGFILDEADVWYPRDADLREIINSGFNRRGATVLRTEDTGRDGRRNLESRRFSTFAPMMLVGNNLERVLARTVVSRALVVRLRPARVTDTVVDLYDNPPAVERLHLLARRVKRWVTDTETELSVAIPDRPEGVINRLWITWRPLLAIADAAGGDWPARARRALEVARARAGDPGLAVEMLRDVFITLLWAPEWRMHTGDLIARLLAVEERAWNTFGKARALIRDVDVARLLEPYELRSKQIKIAGRNRRGYDLADVLVAVETYAPGVLSSLSADENARYRRYPATGPENTKDSAAHSGSGLENGAATAATAPATDEAVAATANPDATAFHEENQRGSGVAGLEGVREENTTRGNGADLDAAPAGACCAYCGVSLDGATSTRSGDSWVHAEPCHQAGQQPPEPPEPPEPPVKPKRTRSRIRGVDTAPDSSGL